MAKANRSGIGARVVAKIGGLQVVRELWPVNTFTRRLPVSCILACG